MRVCGSINRPGPRDALTRSSPHARVVGSVGILIGGKMPEFLRVLIRRLRLTDKAVLAKAVRAILVAAAALGWLTIDDATANAISSAVAAIGSALLTPIAQDTSE